NYLFWFALLLVWPIASMLEWQWTRARTGYAQYVGRTNPFWLALAPYAAPQTTHPLEPVIFLGVCLGLSALLALLTVLLLRPLLLRERVAGRSRRTAVRPAVRPSFHWPLSPSLDGNPVLWREWHRRRPSRWMRAVWITFAVGAVLATVLAVLDSTWRGR